MELGSFHFFPIELRYVPLTQHLGSFTHSSTAVQATRRMECPLTGRHAHNASGRRYDHLFHLWVFLTGWIGR